jgi:hypothetical protein
VRWLLRVLFCSLFRLGLVGLGLYILGKGKERGSRAGGLEVCILD